MLRKLVETGRIQFQQRFDNWEDAVTASCQPLIDDKTIEPVYIKAVIDCIKEYGPYIVLAPNIAVPHSTVGAVGVNGTAICFMKVEEPVHFEEGNPEKDARLFFVLAAENPEKHLENMVQLADMLSDEAFCEELLHVTCAEDLLRLDDKYIAKIN